MAVNNYEEIVKLIVDAGESVTTIESLRQRIKTLRKEADTLDISSPEFAAIQQKIEQLTQAQTKLGQASKQTAKNLQESTNAVKGFGDAAAVSGGAAIALGQLFSDIGQFGFGFAQGVRAIANNVSQLATLFAVLVAQTGGLTAAMRALWASMRGPLGVVVAIQAAVGALDLWAASQRKTKDEADKLNNSILDLSGGFNEGAIKIQALKTAYDQLNPASEQARKLKEEIGKQLKVNINDYEDLNAAIRDHIYVLQLEAEASSLVKSMTDETTKSYIENQKAIRNNIIIQEKITAAELKRSQTQEGSIQEQVLNNEIEKLRQQLLPVSIRQTEEYTIQQERLAQIQLELNGLIKTNTKAVTEEGEALKKTGEEVKKTGEDYSFLINTYQRYLDLTKAISEESIDAEIGILDSEMQKIAKLEMQYEGFYNELEYLRNVDGLSEQEYLMRKEELNIAYNNRLLALKQDYTQKEVAKEAEKQQAIAQLASNTFGFLIALNQALAGETEEERKRAFKRDKALRISQATIDTYRAANMALASAPPPVGGILAAAAIAAGLANVATIAGQQYNGTSTSATTSNMGGIQGGYPYPMSGFSTIQPQFPDRTGSLEITPRTQRIYVLESDITGAQKAENERTRRAGVF